MLTLAKDLLPALTFANWLQGHLLDNIRDLEKVQLDPPFRTPHYNASLESFVGAYHKGRWLPGEFSLANGGALFLDELPHYKPQVLEALRTPLESRYFLLSRAQLHARLPADFQLLAAMNPCLCGYYYFDPCSCNCTQRQIATYLARISGPIRERFGITHLIDPTQELNVQLPHQINCSASDISSLQRRFQTTYQPAPLASAWKKFSSGMSRPPIFNKRKEQHLYQIAWALMLLRSGKTPQSQDWDLALKFQHAYAFFRSVHI